MDHGKFILAPDDIDRCVKKIGGQRYERGTMVIVHTNDGWVKATITVILFAKVYDNVFG